MCFEVGDAQVGQSVFMERLDFELFSEPLFRLIVFTLPQVHPAKVVISIVVIGIKGYLLLKSIDGKSILLIVHVNDPQIVPSDFAFGSASMARFNRSIARV